MKRTQALIHTSIVLFTLTFASSCFMGAFDEPCSSVVDDRARLEAELSENRGERLTFESTNDAGKLVLELRIEEVERADAGSTSSAHALLLALTSSIPHAHATSCLAPNVDAMVTYSVTWTPHGGQATTLHEDVRATMTYSTEARFATNGAHASSLRMFGGVELELIANSIDLHALRLAHYEDSTAPNTRITTE